jgi:hypothetical protein
VNHACHSDTPGNRNVAMRRQKRRKQAGSIVFGKAIHRKKRCRVFWGIPDTRS